MAAHRSTSDPIDRGSQAAIVASLVAADPEMHALAREYVKAGLLEMVNQLKRGDAGTRAAIARSMSGVVTNLFAQSTGDDGLVELRTEMHEMMAEMRGELDIGMDEDEENDTPTPTPEPARRVMVPKS